MATLRTLPSDAFNEHRQGLCPVCHSHRVTIQTHLDVHYEVEVAPGSDDIIVVDERLAGSGWDEADRVNCTGCGWRGSVSDLAR